MTVPVTKRFEKAGTSAAVPLRVLRVVTRLNVGGPARHATTLAAEFQRDGVESLLVYGSADASEGTLEDLVPALGLRAHKIDELGRRIHPWSDLRALWQLTALLFRERPDVVHTHTAKAGALGRIAALVFNATRSAPKRCVVVHTFHGHVLRGYFGPLGESAVRIAERVLATITDRLVTISASQKRELCDQFRVAHPSRTVVVELGLELDELLALGRDLRVRREFGFDPDDVLFTYVGRLVPVKDVQTLLNAFLIVAGRMPAARLVIVGHGQLREQLERSAAAMSLEGRVKFAGWRRDLAAIYAATDVVVLSSINEGTPVAVIEAMAAALPVVATAVGGVVDLVVDGVNGAIVPPRDPETMAAAMERLARDVDARFRMGRQGRSDVGVRFASGRLVADLKRLYKDALAEKRGVPDESSVDVPLAGGAHAERSAGPHGSM